MIGGYGHDDRVCAYAELKALFDIPGAPDRTCVCILADKEETGSDGVSGMQSAAFDCFMEDLCAEQVVDLRRCYEKSFCLSADVTAAFDPNYPDVYEKSNDAKINYGMRLSREAARSPTCPKEEAARDAATHSHKGTLCTPSAPSR